MNKKRLLRFLALGLVLALGGCKPWVKPYERENLSDPIMSFESNPAATTYLNHVYEARESGRGAEGGAGGGCGCN